MKYHKIHGVEKTICTAEQKIAYNLAFRAHISFQEEFNRAKQQSAIIVYNLLKEMIDFEINTFVRFDSKADKYNIDAVFAALSAGLKEYMDNPKIYTTYKEIGQAFPALYQ